MLEYVNFMTLSQRIRTSDRYRWYALAAVMLGTVMAPLDGSVANVALTTIGRAFSTGVDTAEWILLAYLLMTASTVALFGRLGDMIGQKRIYLIGFAVFGASSVMCAFAPSLVILIAARAVQGIGSAMLLACAPAIITNAFPSSERGRAIGMNGAAVATGLTTGPLLGGLIVTYSNWRWIFLINVPISIVALIVAAIILRPEPMRSAEFDAPGSLLAGIGLFSLTLALSRAHVWGWTSPATLGLIALFAIVLPIFLRVERLARVPMLDLALFKNRKFAFSVCASTLYFTALFSIIFTLPVVAQGVLGRNGFQAGLLLFPISALNVVLAPMAGALSDRVPARYLSTFGSSVFAIGTIILVLLPHHPALWMITAAMFICGAGTAVFSQPNNSTIMGNVPPEHRGTAAGILATSRTTGQLLGVAISGAIYFIVERHTGPLSLVPARSVFASVTLILIATSAVSFLRD
ncbi:MAG TPA: MFS transporter [Candidatus Baltobacteraceae bacterium]